MNFPALMTAYSPSLLRVLSPNDGRRAFARTRTLLLAGCALLLVTGGCKSTRAAQVNVQKICSFQMTAGENTTNHDTRDWTMNMDECVIIMNTENEG